MALEPPSPDERIAVAREHAAALQEFAGDRSVIRMRKHIAWYLTGLAGATRARARVNECKSYAELDALLVEYAEYLSRLPGTSADAGGPRLVSEASGEST